MLRKAALLLMLLFHIVFSLLNKAIVSCIRKVEDLFLLYVHNSTTLPRDSMESVEFGNVDSRKVALQRG